MCGGGRRPAGTQEGAISDIKSHEHFSEVLAKAGDTLVLVNFTATWCRPCQRMKPALAALARDHALVVFVQSCLACLAFFSGA